MQFVSVHFLSGSYVPVLMAEAKIYWQKDNYGQVEKVCTFVFRHCTVTDLLMCVLQVQYMHT